MRTEGFSLSGLYHTASRYWWAFFACMLIGGLAGIVFASIRQPIYEASATLLITVDRSRSIVPHDVTVVQAEDRVRALILSDDTLDKALDLMSVAASDIEVFESLTTFRSALRITNRPASFELLVYANEPALAAEAANAWAKASLSALDEAYLHAIRAAEFQNALYEANCTLALHVDGTQEQAVWTCTSEHGEYEPEDLPETILEEVKASRGILPIFTFALGQYAHPPQSPILWARSSLIISGMIIGGLLGSFVLLVMQKKGR